MRVGPPGVMVLVGVPVFVGVAVGPQWGNCTEVVFSVPQAPMVIGPSTTTLPLASVSWK